MNEIVIPPKKDWRGERYGFVRFVNVENERLMEVKLDNLWLEGRKLKANVSRIKRNWKKFPASGAVSGSGGGAGKRGSAIADERGGVKYQGGISKQSFADILKNG